MTATDRQFGGSSGQFGAVRGQSPNCGLRPAPGLRYPAMVRGTPPGTPSRHRTTNRNLSHESSKTLLPFLSITCRSTRVKPLPSCCYPGIGGRRGATSRSAECRIVPRDFVKTRVREGPSAPESCAGGGDTRPGRYGLLLNQQRLGAPGLFHRPVRAPETRGSIPGVPPNGVTPG